MLLNNKVRRVQIEEDNLTDGLILKVHAMCNLLCKYNCYMYDENGNLWRPRPKVMSKQIIDQTARRLQEYMDETQLRYMDIILHGGEPLLAGMNVIRYIVATFKRAVAKDCVLSFTLQTNATLVTDKIADELAELGIRTSVSLDGDKEGNNLRLYKGGRSSYLEAVAGIERLKQRGILDGLLAVIRLENDPVHTANTLLSLCPNVDCLFPITKGWEVEPTTRPSYTQHPTPYADWLIQFHRQWVKLGGPGEGIRTINKIRQFVAAKFTNQEVSPQQRVEWIGPYRPGYLVIETDGSIEQLDGFNMVQQGASQMNTNVFDHGLMHGLVAMLETAVEWKLNTGPKMCQSCPFYAVCGGGLYLNRYGPNNGYLNPSHYCVDLQQLIVYCAKINWALAQERSDERNAIPYASLADVFYPSSTT